MASAQFLLQAPDTGDEHNYQWYEASDTGTVWVQIHFMKPPNQGCILQPMTVHFVVPMQQVILF